VEPREEEEEEEEEVFIKCISGSGGPPTGIIIPSSAEAKNAWSYTSSLPYVFMAWCLIKHKNCLSGSVLS
jgi:hypothetical protein